MTMYLLHPRNYFQVESEKNDSIFLTSILFPTTITQRKKERNELEKSLEDHPITISNFKILLLQIIVRIKYFLFEILLNCSLCIISFSRKWF